MSAACGELLRRFAAALERDVIDWELLDELKSKCDASLTRRALNALAKKLAHYFVSKAWMHYRGAALAGRHPSVAYAEAVYIVWGPWDGAVAPCELLADLSAYSAEAVAKYAWPARWPLLALFVVAAKEEECEIPDAVAEHLGSDEYARLEAFLEDGVGVVEVADREVAVVREGHYIRIIIRPRRRRDQI
ncbi:MAG: hypothetical protein ACO2PM_09140 [Pyrobaculum sp.]|jgi:hypothetical protein